MNIFGFKIMTKSEYQILTELVCNTVNEMNAQLGELYRLKEIEAKYKKLTDRDEKGRFVK
jgi:hypothetical protein